MEPLVAPAVADALGTVLLVVFSSTSLLANADVMRPVKCGENDTHFLKVARKIPHLLLLLSILFRLPFNG